MIAGYELIDLIETRFKEQAKVNFSFPFIIIEIRSELFNTVSDDDEERTLAEAIAVTYDDLRSQSDRLFIRFDLGPSSQSRTHSQNNGDFWLRSLVEGQHPSASVQTPATVRAIHFYGYKGGQARSSVLAFLGRVLATSGWKVLVIDADAEAPSLDVLFRVSVNAPEATLVGVRAGLSPSPLRVSLGRGAGGVDLLAFRPSDARYDLDAAALALEQNLSPASLSSVASDVSSLVAAGHYDLVLLDHRTGLSHSVLPWIRQFPGPIAAFARMDEQWKPARAHLRALWRSGGASDPGVIVSLKLDTDSLARYRTRVRPQIEQLLDDLATVSSLGSDASEEERPTGEDLADHWIVWPYDQGFVSGEVPTLKQVGGPVLDATNDLRRLLDLGGERSAAALHRSGARDEGDLIQTAALRTLSATNDYLFVLGRKGTGKTRLVRALAEAGTGEPILVADDFSNPTGIKANWPEWKALAEKFKKTPIRLWWLLFTAALEVKTTERSALSDQLVRLRSESMESLIQRCRRNRSKRRRLFLIDGLETAFEQPLTLTYIASLIQFISAIDGDDDFAAKARVQIFVRTDLAKKGYENFEQLSQRRTWNLEWDAQAILNFVLSRILSLPWFASAFQAAVSQIAERQKDIRDAAIEIGEAEELLLEIFPERLRRLNLKMTTYLRTYFSDDPSGEKSFYPRIYDEFLGVIAGDHKGLSSPELEGSGKKRRIGQALVYLAHERATAQFLTQVRSELKYLVDLTDPEMDRLLEALRGTRTPFRLDSRLDEIASKTRINKGRIRLAMDQMLNIGIFEVREGYPGQWRVGRLFKSSLGMIYARGDQRVL